MNQIHSDFGDGVRMKRVIGVVEEEKLEILRSCAVGFFVELRLESEANVLKSKDERPIEVIRDDDSSREDGHPDDASEEGMVVPNTASFVADPVSQIDRMWEGNRREDWRVWVVSSMSRSWSNDEETGLVNLINDSCLGTDGLKDVVVPMNEVLEGNGDVVPLSGLRTVIDPEGRGADRPNSKIPRANIAITIALHNGQLKCARQVSEINLSFLSPTDRVVAECQLDKKERGRPKAGQRQRVANASLPDFDF
ncbi:hypothetical protein V6N13_008113 [Hibiscus sabdariffa]